MNRPRDWHSNKPGREGKISYDIPYMQNLKKKKKKDRIELTKQKEIHRFKNELMAAWGNEQLGNLRLTRMHCNIKNR